MIKIIKSYKFWKVCICYNDEKEKKKIKENKKKW